MAIFVLIDTWWNVNQRNTTSVIFDHKVLIDTWWNVNKCTRGLLIVRLVRFNRYMVECEYRKKAIIFRIVGVLIDTWWNVNERYFKRLDFINSFNRYMVECEFENYVRQAKLRGSFNRYMVECEYFKHMQLVWYTAGFNRYMVECELSIGGRKFVGGASVLIDTWWNVNEFREAKYQIVLAF